MIHQDEKNIFYVVWTRIPNLNMFFWNSLSLDYNLDIIMMQP